MTRSTNLASIEPQTTALRVVRSAAGREVRLGIDDHFRLPRLSGTLLPRRLLTTTYYDTAQYHLAKSGIILRRRVEHGLPTWHLTLPLIDDRLDIEDADRRPMPPSSLVDLLLLPLDRRPLIPVAMIRIRRSGVRVHGEHGPSADVTIDHAFVVRHGEVNQRFRELKIQRINGEDTILSDLERQFRRAGAGDHDGRPKVLRALSLHPIDVWSRPAPDAPVVVQLSRALARQVQRLIAHDPGTRLGREPESLHQMRVATRQLRAILHAAQPLLASDWVGSFEDELAWLSQVLGPARDLDVQLDYVRNEMSTLEARDRAPLIRYVEHLEAQREHIQDTLLKHLNSPRYLTLIHRLSTAPRHPVVVNPTLTLPDLAKREFKKLRKAIRSLGSSPNHALVHEVRIKTKRARCAAELAEPVMGKPAARFIKQARALADMLGVHQDALQAETHVRAFLKHSTNVRAAFVAGRMVERQRERRKEARKAVTPLSKRVLKRGKQAWLQKER